MKYHGERKALRLAATKGCVGPASLALAIWLTFVTSHAIFLQVRPGPFLSMFGTHSTGGSVLALQHRHTLRIAIVDSCSSTGVCKEDNAASIGSR